MIARKGNPVGGLIFIILISAFAIYLLFVGFVGNTIATELQSKIGITEEINNSLQTTITTSTITLNTLWYVLFAGLLLGLIVQAMMARDYPKVFVPIFVLTLIVTIILAIVMSNAYDMIADQTTLSSAAGYQSGIHFIMNKLPYIAVIVGIMSLIIIFTRGAGVSGGGAIIN